MSEDERGWVDTGRCRQVLPGLAMALAPDALGRLWLVDYGLGDAPAHADPCPAVTPLPSPHDGEHWPCGLPDYHPSPHIPAMRDNGVFAHVRRLGLVPKHGRVILVDL